MGIEDLGWGVVLEVRGVAELQQSTVKIFTINVACRSCLEDEVLHSFDCYLGMTVRLWVVWGGDDVMNSPSLHKIPELTAGELWASICAQAEGYTNFPEVAAEDPGCVERGCVTFAWDDNEPARESVCDDEEGFTHH